MGASGHISVMAEEVLFWLVQQGARTYLDCTVGYSGHAEKILETSDPDCRLIGIDRDVVAIAASRERLARFGDRVRLFHGHFADLKQHLAASGIGRLMESCLILESRPRSWKNLRAALAFKGMVRWTCVWINRWAGPQLT